ncbi:MAG: Uma2 family endonuclease [Polyangiaceae bacterium]|nr:Uma2 family endonuclease [Polyangiaceae bacterium]MBK8999028.1 Uma2 family endonuclease [Myxococcales bacterium]
MSSSFVALRYAVRPQSEAWVLPEGKVPESVPHDRAAERLKSVLSEWARGLDRPVAVARNLAVRWLEETPRVGIDPDVCVLDPPPPGIDEASSLCLWRPGHQAPSVCFEIVSANHPHKDYRDVHERYAALGTPELVVFDPLLAGPASLGGPVPIQLWRLDETGAFERVYAGPGPVYCEGLDAFLTARERHLIVSDDARGEREWLPAVESAERERAEKERERAEKERERAEKERERAEKERERAERLRAEQERAELAARLAALEARVGLDGPKH